MTAWLVVNADDLGVSRGATAGVVRGHREGIITSASLAVTTPHYTHAVEECVRQCPDLGIGLHFTLTSGSPVSAAKSVPSLVRPDGMFSLRFMTLLARTSASAGSTLMRDIAAELEAQLMRLRDDGIRPDHINGERHVHLIPGIFEIVAAAAQRHGISYIRVGRDIGFRYLSASHAIPVLASGGVIKSGLLSTLSSRARRRLGGTASPDYVASYVHTGRLDVVLPELLRRPAIDGVTEVMVHPGVPEENGKLELGNDELESYLMSADRRAELDACVAARGSIGSWQLTNYRALSARAA